jgi:Kdo2-lipid A phosphotransferase
MKMQNLTKIILFNLIGIALLASYQLTGHNGFWFHIDSMVFHFFNAPLDKSTIYLYLVAITNHRLFDIISFAAMGLLYLTYFRGQDCPEKRRMICIGITMLLMAVIIKQLGRFVPFDHASPTLFFDHINRVSQLTHFGTKDASADSFPGDHGMMLMIFTAFMGRYFGRNAFIKAAMIVIIFSLPRIMAGAHWFTDVYVGSLAIVCIVLSWFLLTPASDYIISRINHCLPKNIFCK